MHLKKSWLVAALTSGMVLAATLGSPLVQAQSFVIEDIRFEGLLRISEGTVLNYLPVSKGDKLDDERQNDVIHRLFKTGFFEDIKLERTDKNVLIVHLVERPAIGRIKVSGNKLIKKDDLIKALKEAGLAEGRTFDKMTLSKMKQELERQYFSHGKYAVKVEANVTNKPRNRVEIDIKVKEGAVTKIKEINIVGNQHFSEKELRKQFKLSTGSLTSWFTKVDQYDKQKLSADLEKLRAFYMDRGFLNFDITSTQVQISPDKSHIYITVAIHEGKPFKVSDIELIGDFVVPKSELQKLMTFKKGQTFSREEVTKSVKALQDKLGEHGYTFANVNPIPDIQEGTDKVKIVFYLDPGRRTYVRNITFTGNRKTKDQVLRQSMIQQEGAWASSTKIEQSKEALNRLGFFSEVEVETKPITDRPDAIDLVYKVTEQSSGQISGGIGYSGTDGILFNANVSNRNFLGTGEEIEFNFNQSKANTTYSVGYNDPFFTVDGMSRGFNVFYNKTELSKTTELSNYITDAWGGNVNYGFPITAYQRVSFGYGYQATDVKFRPIVIPTEIDRFMALMSGREYNAKKQKIGLSDSNINMIFDEVTLNVGWTYNTLDRFNFPTKGNKIEAQMLFAVPGADLQYYKGSLSAQSYYPLPKDFIFLSSGTLGFGDAYSKTPVLPFYKNFYAGGLRSVKGFGQSTLGPRDSFGNPFGGNFLVNGSLNLIVPNFFLEKDNRSVRVALFLDGGQVYDSHRRTGITDTSPKFSGGGPRFSTGATLSWMSPLGPLVFSYGKPLNQKRAAPGSNQITDKVQTFDFSFGTFF